MNDSMKQTVKGILHVGAGNVLKVISGVLVGFALPRLLSVEGYGFVRTCTLYAAYVGLFSTGIIDGIALQFGGAEAETLDRPVFRRYSRCFLGLEVLFALLACAVGILSGSSQLAFILSYLAVFLLTNNITSYCTMLSQITGRFGQLSRFTQLQSLFGAGAVSCLLFFSPEELHASGARWYLLLYTAGNLLTMGLYLFRWRDLILGKAAPYRQQRKHIFRLIRTGTPLMIANLCTLLILSADRQCVNILCDASTYAVYAFAYNMMTMITMVISAISTVLFPTMKRMDKQQLLAAWPGMSMGIPLIVFFCLMVYYPLVPFIHWFLPDYVGALDTLRVVFPGLAVSSVVTIVIHNYDKTLGLSDRFCVQSLIVLVLSVLANAAAWHFFHTTGAISFASVVMLFLWYLMTASTLHRRFGCSFLPGLEVLFGGLVLFELCTMPVIPLWLGMLIQLSALCAAACWIRKKYTQH